MNFNTLHLSWGGKEYHIPADQVMKAIARVEETVTFGELAEMLSTGRLKFAKISQAYATFLRYAGAMVTDEEVFFVLFPRGSADVLNEAMGKLYTLIVMMSPPMSVVDLKKVDAAGKPPAATQH